MENIRERGAYRVLLGKPGGRRAHGRHRRRWEDNIEMDLQEVEWGVGLWTVLICIRRGTVGGSGECGSEPSG
jgi:hypothetical protein